MSARVKLDNRERGYYASLYQAADALNTGQIGGAQAVGFFKRSGLSIEILKKIWLLSSPNNQTLNKEEFYIALKLISYAQNNIDVSLDSITRGIPSPLPQFQSDTEEVYRLRPEQERLYQNYVQSLDHSNHTVSTQLAMNLFQKTPLSSFQLQTIISLIDSQLQSKPRMTTHQYIIVAHLISLASQGVAIPQKLPHSLQEFLNSEVIPQPKQAPAPVIQKSNDLMDFEAKFEKAKSPVDKVDKYSALKNLDLPAAGNDAPTLIQTQPSHLVTSQSFKVQSSTTQGPVLRQQKSIDLMMSDLDGNSQQPVIAPIQQPIVQQQVIQQQTIQQQALQQQTLKQQVDFSKQALLQEQMQIQQQQFETSLKQTNELLNEFREQHEKMLISTQSQLESLQTANEQYKTILKKISDENDLFQEELKQIEQQKKKLTETLSRQAVEINQKLGFNIQLKQEYTKQSIQGMNVINDLANTIIGDFKSQYEIEQERKKRADQELIKELKGQKESIQHLSEQVNLLVKDMKSQRKNSVPYTAIDTHETEQIQQPFLPPINSNLVSFQKGGESKKLFDDANHFTEYEIPQQFQEIKIENVQITEKIEQPEAPKLQVDLFSQDFQIKQTFVSQEPQPQQLVFPNDPIIQPVNPLEFNVAASVSPKNLIEQTSEQENKIDDQIPEIQEEQHETNEPKITFEDHHQQDFNFKFDDGFGEHFNNRESTDKDQLHKDSIDIEQNPSLTFDQQFGQTITFGFGQTKPNEVQIEFDANKEFGAEWTGFQENFANKSPQQQDDFTGFKW